MKVCLISSGIPSNVGGVENVVNELSNYLSQSNIDVTVMGKSKENFIRKSGKRTIVGFRMTDYLPRKLHFAHYEDYNSQLKIWRIFPKENFDIVHGGNDNSLFLLLFAKKRPLILTFHGTLAGGIASRKNAMIPYHYFLNTAPEAISARRCDVVVACSKKVKQEIETFYKVKSNKIKVIYNGVNTQLFRPIDNVLARKNLGLPTEGRYAIWVGTNPTLKRLDLAIKATRLMKGMRLLVVGVNGKSDENVIYFGAVTDLSKRILLYNCANFLIFPTRYEGFPLVPLEAMACGLPIFISKECPTKEIIREGIHGFIINEKKPEAYAEKIEKLTKNETMYLEASTSCRKLAEKYSWENQGREYLNLYKKLI